MRCPIGFTTYFYEKTQDRAAWTADMDRLQFMGATAVRAGLTPGIVAEKNLAHVEWCLQDAARRGLKVLLTTAQLANSTDDSVPMETKYQQAVDYVAMLAQRLAQYVTWWQVLNEHDVMSWDTYQYLGAAWTNERGMFRREGMTDEYLETVEEVLSRCRDAIHAVRPDLPVGTALSGESVNSGNETYQWRPFHRIVQSVDFVGINGYPFDNPVNYEQMPARLRRTSHWMSDLVDRRVPVILTEIGLPTLDGEDVEERREWIAHQVDYGTRSADVAGLFVYQLVDNGSATGPEATFGMYTTAGSLKPGARAVRAMIRSFTGGL